MRRFRTGIILIFSLCFLLCGCHKSRNKSSAPLNLTKTISIDCHYRQHHLLRTYTDAEKIDVILRYLHRLSPTSPVSNIPNQITSDRCQITLTLFNGSTRSYELQNKEYLRRNSGDWYSVDPKKANVIYHLINHIESD